MILARRALLGAAWLPAAAAAAAAPRPRVGAIRWDAWYAPGSVPTEAVRRSLSVPDFAWRAPFFARPGPEGPILDMPPEEALRIEMRQAREAGLDYWAFYAYGRADGMSRALDAYLAMPGGQGPGFCFFQQPAQWFDADLLAWRAERMGDPRHERAPDGRPLTYVGPLNADYLARLGGPDGLRRATERFREAVLRRARRPPYIVLVAPPAMGAALAPVMGADALGAYALAGRAAGAPFAALARFAESRWEEYAATGLPFVPLAMVGWDRRPRVVHPVPWEAGQLPGAGLEFHYLPAGPGEFAAHLRRAMAVAGQQAPRTALVYAWNENDEGGYLVPTQGCRHDMLGQLGEALGRTLPQDGGLCTADR